MSEGEEGAVCEGPGMHCVGREVLEGGMQGGNRKIEAGDELEPGEGRRDVVGG